jgi:protein TonB
MGGPSDAAAVDAFRTSLRGGHVSPGHRPCPDPTVPISPAGWITNNDYPQLSLENKERGTTAFRLDIDATGSVIGCTITESSGYRRLDDTACKLMRKRGRFKPATDAGGAAVPGDWSSRFNWWVES